MFLPILLYGSEHWVYILSGEKQNLNVQNWLHKKYIKEEYRWQIQVACISSYDEVVCHTERMNKD